VGDADQCPKQIEWFQISTNVAALDCALHQRINRSLDLTAKCLKWEANVFLLADLRTNRTIEGPIIPGRNGGKNELMGFRTAVPGQAP